MATSELHGWIELDQFRPIPGQHVVLLTRACLALAQAQPRSHWPELARLLERQRKPQSAVCVVAIPDDLNPPSALALCRAAHEVWVMESDASPLSRLLRAFRTQSAPPLLNESKSVLHAPEIGLLRVWRRQPSAIVEQHLEQPMLPMRLDGYAHLAKLYALMEPLPSISPADWAAMGQVLRQHAANRRRLVRLSLAGLFALTVLGVSGLQVLSMSPLRIPMADLYAVFYLLVGSLYLWGKRQQWNTEQLAWMCLAEALEAQALLGRAGLRQGAITGLFLLHHRRSVEWIREALRPMTWALFAHVPDAEASAKQMLSEWVPQALHRHRDLAQRQRRKSSALARGMLSCYTVGGVLTAVAVGGVVQEPSLKLAVSIGIGMTSALGTLMLIFNNVLGFAADADLHDHLADVYRQAQRCLGQSLSPHEYDELLLDLVQEGVQQSAERVLL